MTTVLSTSNSDTIKRAIALLEAAEFVVIEKFSQVDQYSTNPCSNPKLGAILDTETTGRNLESDRVIELGIVFFKFNPDTGEVLHIVDVFNKLQDPGMPISPDASAINGITDDMVAGQVINAAEVTAKMQDVDLVIAHNAAFDRPLCEKEWPIFKEKAWACSFRQVDWAQENLSSAKLEFIAFKRKFHFEAHRAEMDCRVLLHILQGPLGATGSSTLKSILDVYLKKEIKVSALGTAFSVKDVLKNKGYSWDVNKKVWYRMVAEDNLQSELAWLSTNAYFGRPATVGLTNIDAFTRFSNREPASTVAII